MSILGQNLNSNSSGTFWNEEQYSSSSCCFSEVILRDTILIKAETFLQEREICLTSNAIYYKLSENLVRITKIKWALIESFYEEDSGKCLFGFRLIKPEGKEDFFTTSETVLGKWLEKLAELCLMTGFDLDFMVVKKIDSGKFGDVCLCQELNGSEEYAAKFIRKELLRNYEQIKFVKNEIKAMRKINHPLFVKLFRVYEEDDFIMLVMEYIPHGNLLNRIHKYKKFAEHEVAQIASELISALCVLNSSSIIHRDLKPDNILMLSSSNNYEIKIADFGLCSCSSKPQTQLCGSPGFMAPEALKGQAYNSKFDIFSVGVILYVLLTGKMPFPSKSVKNLLEDNEKCDIKFDKKTWKEYSAVALNFVQGLMDKDKLRRPSAEMAMGHPWLSKYIKKSESEATNISNLVSDMYIQLN